MAQNKDNFEKSLKRLEEIVGFLESGDAPLDKSLSVFEEGVKLVKECNTMLENAERKIEILKKQEDGEYVTEDFTEDK